MKKKLKGEHRYFEYKTMIEAVKTATLFVLAVGCFLFGYIKAGSPKNLFTIAAMLGVLPACKLLTTLILYLTRKKFHDNIYNRIHETTDAMNPLYEMILTSDKKSYYLNCLVVIDNSIYGITEFSDFDENKFKNYLKPILVSNGFKTEPVIKIFDKEDAFLLRMKELKDVNFSEKDAELRHLLTCLAL